MKRDLSAIRGANVATASVVGLMALFTVAGCSDEPQLTDLEPDAAESRAASQVDRAPSEELVFTPAGWYHRSCVYEVPNRARVSAAGVVTRPDGSHYRLTGCAHPGRRTAEGKRAERPGAQPPVNNGWVEWAWETLWGSDVFRGLSASWDAPAEPIGSYSGVQVYYTFPGLQSTVSHPYIIQPVLQYGYNGAFGGSRWVAASWHCDDGTHCTHSSAINVASGNEMLGSVTASDCQSGQCSWTILTRNLTRQTQSTWVVTDADQYQWAFGGAVEVYGLSACNQYPRTGVLYSSISLTDQNGFGVLPTWSNQVATGLNPECDFGVSSSTYKVNLYHNPPPPPAVDIVGPYEVQQHVTCTWDSRVTGGVSPYTYQWRRDNTVVSTSSSYTTWDSGASDFLLELRVWDADQDLAFDYRTITVDGFGQIMCEW